MLPLVPGAGVPVHLWSLFPSRSEGPFDLGRTFAFSPDLGLTLVVMTTLGFGWGIVRTILTLRLMRTSGPKETAQGSDPIASPA